MKDIIAKFQLNYLGPGILLYMLLSGFGEFASAQIIGGPTGANPGNSGVIPLADRQIASTGRISLESYTLDPETATHWKLPRELEEVSGLAMTGDNRLLAHNDERAIIYEIDYRYGSIAKAFQLSDTNYPAAGDFEGIAATEDGIFLVTSTGRLYECREGNAGQSVLFNVYATGVGRDCEIEGLAYDRTLRELILLCKEARNPDMEGKLALCRWSIDKRRLDYNRRTVIAVDDFSRHIKGKKFHPSGIERHPTSGNLYIVAARQESIAEISPDGRVLAVRKLPAKWHRQAEGITFAADGTLIVADEGAGRKGRLTLYPVSDRP
ncbi:MAG: SdiA-regulated domain-containing protein [Gemmatimonadota bacterium]|nr:SdiA-regulated domain-containing protein [Gemmatimonadota bacterium]